MELSHLMGTFIQNIENNMVEDEIGFCSVEGTRNIFKLVYLLEESRWLVKKLDLNLI
jgi:hypothetical protein